MPSAANSKKRDPIKPWFEALESMGEYIGIRFGHLRPGSGEVEWIYFPHSECDGIGAFAHMFREAGIPLETLPQISHPAPYGWKPFFQALPKLLGPRRRLAWNELPRGEPLADTNQPAPAVAWHVFSETETRELLDASRSAGVTLNSFLLKHLDSALRPDLADPGAAMPWMVPVNIRGKVNRESDTENHTSYVAFHITAEDSLNEVHGHIYRTLDRGEHWAAWKGYRATRLLPRAIKRLAIKTDRVISQWNVGGFSNLGVWDRDNEIDHDSLAGSWLFCPPVLRCQMVGAGCVTFQNRLSLLIQAHPDLTTAPEVPRKWLERWLSFMEAPRRESPNGAGTDEQSTREGTAPEGPQLQQAVQPTP